MSMRDLVLFAILAILVFRIPPHPYIGALAWVVVSVMNPHRLAWGAAFGFPFAMVIAIATLIGLAITKDHRQIKGGGALAVLLTFFALACVTTPFAFELEDAVTYLIRISKIFLMTLVLLAVLHTRRHVDLLIWAIVVSLGLYGVKGGMFTIATGAQHIVWGPDESVIAGRNAMAVGLIVVIPLMFYLFTTSASRWVRRGLIASMALCAIAVLGSYSRGAMLAIIAMGAVLWLRGKNKLPLFIASLVFMTIALYAMPEQWGSRMHTLENYQEEGSAMGRIYAWQTAYNIAIDKFPLGGGLQWQSETTSARYSPVPTVVLVAHSNYFQVLGSLGFLGLALYLLFWALVWRQCAWIRCFCRDRPDMKWAHSLASMVQVALVGYLVGGAFLDLAYWDLAYYLFAAMAVTRYVVSSENASHASTASTARLRASSADVGAQGRISVAASQRSPGADRD